MLLFFVGIFVLYYFTCMVLNVQGRLKNPSSNPGKLTPPCLREQIQSMLDVFRDLLSRALTPAKKSSNSAQDQQGPHPNGGIVRQPRTKTNASESMEAPVKGAAALMKAREKMESTLLQTGVRLQHAEMELAKRETRQQELMHGEEAKWEEFADIQRSKQSMVLDGRCKATIDARLRSVMEAASSVSTALKALTPEIKHWTDVAEALRMEMVQLQDAIGHLSAEIDVLIVQESCLRPQQFFLAFPINGEGMVSLKQHLPCVLCGRYWAEMALANLPCGCLLHPLCLYQVALGSHPCCPGCNVKPTGGWMGQWGFKTDNASQEIAVAAVHKKGWAPPLGRHQLRLQDVQLPKRKGITSPEYPSKRSYQVPSFDWVQVPLNSLEPTGNVVSNIEASDVVPNVVVGNVEGNVVPDVLAGNVPGEVVDSTMSHDIHVLLTPEPQPSSYSDILEIATTAALEADLAST